MWYGAHIRFCPAGGFPICPLAEDVFWLKEAPGKTLVIGAAYIALASRHIVPQIWDGRDESISWSSYIGASYRDTNAQVLTCVD